MKNFQLATFYHRFSALFFDLFVVSILYGIIIAIITMKPERIFSRFYATSGSFLINFIVVTIVFIIFLVIIPKYNKGMTLGQKIIRIKMIKDNYEETKMGMFLVRFLFIYILSFLFLGIPLIVNAYLVIFRKDHKTLQDMVFKTSFIQVR